jgi:glycosyltransferase involved in cell wall biosynthesis
MKPYRLAILDSHVIQYFAPMYRRLAQEHDIDLTVYYCSRQGLDSYNDSGFGGVQVQWDIPLLDGYRSVFLDNLRREGGGVGGFWSLINPSIVSELRHGHYDALWVHGHNYATHQLAYWCAKYLGIAVFTRGDSHLGTQRTGLKRWVRKPLMNLFYAQCDACLAIGNRNSDYYQFHGVPKSKIFFVPFTVDNAYFMRQADAARAQIPVLKAELGLREGLPVLLYASKFLRRKHPMGLLRAKFALEQEGIECEVLMIGAGEEDATLRQYCVEQGLRNVHFLGFRNQSELPSFYALADIFVLPSENEPWGLIINEVMCAGVAVVATEEIGAVADLVRSGENGLLYPARDIDALVSILRSLVLDTKRCHEMGCRSREIIANWSYEQCVEGIKSALRTVRPA